MADSKSDNAPIGAVAWPAIKGIVVEKAPVGGLGARFSTAPAPAPVIKKPMAAAPTPVVKKPAAKSVRFTEEAAPAPAPAPVVEEEAQDEVAVPTPAPVAEEKEITVTPAPAPAPIKPKPAVAAATDEAPEISREQFITDLIPLREKLVKARPAEIVPAGAIYRPISSASFSDFIVQTYNQYSPMLQRVLREGAAAARAPKELDRDACRRRDPNKVETFYYQKFVRDYLSRDTPYRGLLVYHGLGTGKTCTSIAAAEALYWGGQRIIYVLTPATLSNNYRRELGKCGYFPLRIANDWAFLRVPDFSKPTREAIWLTEVLGLPKELVRRQGGGWVPNPDRPSNWETLSAADRESIRAQQRAHLNHRFRFIHYNGVSPELLSQLAMDGVRRGSSIFDNAVVIVDEIHNLVRTINGTLLGSKPIPEVIKEGGAEPREATWSAPMGRERPGLRYPRGYVLYRLLTNAVGAKIIALSATPMINYSQELAILMNIVGGDQRMGEISLRAMARDPGTLRRLEDWARAHPTVDFWAVEEGADKKPVLNVTPVPYGFTKVVGVGAGAPSGFVRMKPREVVPIERAAERQMDQWALGLVKELAAAGILPADSSAEPEAAVTAARAAGPGAVPKTAAFRLRTLPLLPESAKEFVGSFVDRATLKILHANVLKARCTGLVSYYRGGSEEMMPRVTRDEVVRVPMNDYMFGQYVALRDAELAQETGAKKDDKKEGAAGAAATKRKGATAAEMELYAQATQTLQTGFKALSRAACNWVFPEEVERPKMSAREKVAALGIDQERIIAADLAVDTEAPPPPTIAAATEETAAEPTEAALPDEPEPPAPAPTAEETAVAGIVGTLLSELEAKGDEYLNRGLATYSPKYAAILTNIRASPGPVLVYSQFKTMEGLGIFAAALRAAPERYMPLDIVRPAGATEWEIPAGLMTPEARARPRYILYTGDQDLEKRRLLLQLYNADVAGLPPRLSAQCAELLAGAPDNRDGRVARIFMITQSGAEGISLFNTRQVHVMEPYWNNVRIQQVIGRAIRLCSHMNLPWEERTVEVYRYLSVFDVAKGQKYLPDMNLTTDEIIFDIAGKKQRLADGLAEIAQSAAVDCELHAFEHGETIKCFKFAAGARPAFMFHPDWQKDLAAASTVRAAAAGAGSI